MPNAIASTHSVNSSREPVRVTLANNHGTTRVPTTSASVTNTATLASVTTNVSQRFEVSAMPRTATGSPPNRPASAGNITSISTITRSSTMSQPTAIFPSDDCNPLRSSSARSRTIVLATDSDSPNTNPAPI